MGAGRRFLTPEAGCRPHIQWPRSLGKRASDLVVTPGNCALTSALQPLPAQRLGSPAPRKARMLPPAVVTFRLARWDGKIHPLHRGQ